jgi:hypothetical protein
LVPRLILFMYGVFQRIRFIIKTISIKEILTPLNFLVKNELRKNNTSQVKGFYF